MKEATQKTDDSIQISANKKDIFHKKKQSKDEGRINSDLSMFPEISQERKGAF
jgi:hypothetical protein